MSILGCLLLVLFCGALGGLAACFQKDTVVLPKFDKRIKTLKPGAIGTILIGAIAAGVVWALYGPASGYDLARNQPLSFPLPLCQLAGSFLTGLSGGAVLKLLADKQTTQFSRDELAKLLKNAVENPEE